MFKKGRRSLDSSASFRGADLGKSGANEEPRGAAYGRLCWPGAAPQAPPLGFFFSHSPSLMRRPCCRLSAVVTLSRFTAAGKSGRKRDVTRAANVALSGLVSLIEDRWFPQVDG